jgi:transcription initiation factor TFIIE subunit alpha
MILKITKKLIYDVTSKVVGDDAVDVVKNIYGKKDVSEFEIADSINSDINRARNILYRLYNNNIVSFMKKKDRIKGWYVYFWTLNKKRFGDLANDLEQKKIEILQRQINREKDGVFYKCENNCIRLNFETAFDFNFRCPECNEILDSEDNSTKINLLERELNTLTSKTA